MKPMFVAAVVPLLLMAGAAQEGPRIAEKARRLDETLAQALEVSAHPLVATHHGLRSLNDIPRNMPDDLLRTLAAKGGVIGFHIGNSFHHRPYFERRTAQAGRPFWDTSAIGRREAALSIHEIDRMLAPRFPMVGPVAPDEVLMSVDDWVGVVDRAIQIVGEDHVALGSDFDGRRHRRTCGTSPTRDDHGGHAAAGLLRGSNSEVPGREPPAGLPGRYRESSVKGGRPVRRRRGAEAPAVRGFGTTRVLPGPLRGPYVGRVPP